MHRCARTCGRFSPRVWTPATGGGRCRRAHTSAFGAFLRVDRATLPDGPLGRFADHCDGLGACERQFCSRCYSMLATRPAGGGGPLLALGSSSANSHETMYPIFPRNNILSGFRSM